MPNKKNISSKDRNLICRFLDPKKERNSPYTHKNPFISNIFWQRLTAVQALFQGSQNNGCALDIGGGNGVLAYFMSDKFSSYCIIDPDAREAEIIAEAFNLGNVRVVRAKIEDVNLREKANVIFATDVLEHFKDLSLPLRFIKRHMSKNGKLVVTLPSENLLYTLGRMLIGKKKPNDHYHPAKNVLRFLSTAGLKIVHHEYSPKYLINIPLFSVAVLTF